MNQPISSSNNDREASPTRGCYTTFDLGLTSALTQVGFALRGLDRSSGRKVEFIFDRTPELEDAVRRFWSGELMVDAQGYFEAIRVVKNRIYSSE